MAWLLSEIFVFVVAGVIFGGLMGLGLAALAAKRRAAADSERERQGASDQLLAAERGRRAAESRAIARGAAEAAARGDLETRLIEMESAAADYRARAEAAERRLHLMDSPASTPELIPPAEASAPSAQPGTAPSEEVEGLRGALAQQAREIESLAAQLAAAERVRARSESDLAIAQARAEEALRAATGLGRAGPDQGEAEPQGERPAGLPGPRDGRADDLRRIRGIGPKNEGVLNSLGIYHYEQIAALTPAQAAWLDNYLKLYGRIARDDWVGQAGALLGDGSGPGDKVHPHDVGA